MKILEVAGSGKVARGLMGPVTRNIYELSKEFCQLGHEVTVADTGPEAPRAPFPFLRIEGTPRSMDNSIENERRLIDDLVTHKLDRFDVIHAHEWESCYFLWKHGYRTIYTSHTPTWLVARGRERARDLLRRLSGRHEYWVIKRALLTIALGDYFRIPNANICVIPNGIRAEEWRKVHVAKSNFTIVLVGRVSPIKGVHLLIDAVRMLRFPVEVFILGSLSGVFGESAEITSYAKSMVERARGLPIHFTGFVPHGSPEFLRYLSMADLGVIPSSFESQSTAALEFLAMGVPIVASSVGGLRGVVHESVGRLFAPGDSRALCERITELHDDERGRLELATRARPYVVQNFSWRSCAERYLRELKALTDSSPGISGREPLGKRASERSVAIELSQPRKSSSTARDP